MSADLERDLRSLATVIEWPATPDLAPGVAAGLTRPPRPRARRRRVTVALAFAALLLVPGAAAFGDDVLEWLGLRSVEVRREPLPPDARRPALDELGPPMKLAEAARRAGFAPVLPPRLGTPEEVRVRGGVATLVYDGGATLLAEQRGALDRALVQKSVGTGTVERVPGGLFFSGGEHTYLYLRPDGKTEQQRPFLAGDTLVVERGDLLLRLEGRDLTARRALALLGR